MYEIRFEDIRTGEGKYATDFCEKLSMPKR